MAAVAAHQRGCSSAIKARELALPQQQQQQTPITNPVFGPIGTFGSITLDTLVTNCYHHPGSSVVADLQLRCSQ